MGEEKSQPPPPFPGESVGPRETLQGGLTEAEEPSPSTLRGGLVRAPISSEQPIIDGFEDTPMPEAVRSSSRGSAAFSPAEPPPLPIPSSPIIHIGEANPGDEAPPSSRASKPPSSVAPPLPQIPKPIASIAPPKLAPGIVSGQSIPTQEPVKKPVVSPLLVAGLAAVIGGVIALIVLLALKPKQSAETSVTPSAASAPPPPAAAPPATVAATATAPAAPPPSDAPAAPAPSGSAAPSTGITAASARVSSGRAGPGSAPHTKPKSDRIED